METIKSFETDLYAINEQSFDKIALQLFRYQAEHNPIYQQYIGLLGISIDSVDNITKIPFLPISFFKNHLIKTGAWNTEATFASSGTTGSVTSRHPVYSIDAYLTLCEKTFQHYFGPLEAYHFIALLPSYLERSDSSLVLMIESFIKKSKSPHSQFYSHDHDAVVNAIKTIQASPTSKKIILWGVTFALLDLVERYTVDLHNCLVFETGGMKGKRKETTRAELHSILKTGFNVEAIYSEYGMTELLSQAYTKGGNEFYCGSTMKVLAREVTDPLNVGLVGETGGLNIIDLANVHTIAFIAAEDLGKVYSDGSFEVLGRLDNTDVRGCNLLMQ